MNKNQIRQLYLQKRKSLPTPKRQALSEKALSNLIHTNWYTKSTLVFTFINFKEEINTILLIKQMFKDKKRVCVPIVNRKEKFMEAIEIFNIEDLQIGYFGILEPTYKKERIINKRNIDLCITPGLVYDEQGFRIGYGGGFYDKFLSGTDQNPILIGYGFDFQLVKNVPHEGHDIPLDGIVTDKRIHQVNQKK